jgi:hypothetical protein
MYRKSDVSANIFFAAIGSILFASCGKFDPSENGSSNCTMTLNDNSWTKSVSPNIGLFPSDKLYYSVKASASNCSNIMADSKDIKVTLNFKSSINNVGSGDSLVFVAMASDVASKPVYVANDVSVNFKNGDVNRMLIDSSSNLDWKPPFNKPNNFVLTFMVPSLIESTYQHYPKGNIFIEKKK